MHAAAAVGAHLVTAAEGRSFLCAWEVQIWCGVTSCKPTSLFESDMGEGVWRGVTCVMCSCLGSAMARWGSSLSHHLSENATASPGSLILQQKRECGHRNEWAHD